MSCKECYGCMICHNHKVIDKVTEIEKVDIPKTENFGIKRTLSGKLIGVRNETETINKKDS